MGEKRRRLALSCVDCRRRKVKCDRTSPKCIRCQKGGINCIYVSYRDKAINAIPTPTDDSPQARRERSTTWAEDAETWQARSANHGNAQPVSDKLTHTGPKPQPQTRPGHDLEQRISELESFVRAADPKPGPPKKYFTLGHPAGPCRSADKNDTHVCDRVLLRGKAFKTQYFGPSHAASLLLQFEELSRFVKDILHRIPKLEKVRDCLKKLRQKNMSPTGTSVSHGLDSLVPLVPDRERADLLVHEYFETCETTYRVLHAPTFFRDYENFWNSPGDSTVPFVVQLLLVCAAVNVVVPGGPPGFIGRGSLSRQRAITWINVCEDWLDMQSHKHVTLAIFQIRVLVVMAKRMNCAKIKREWTVAGHLLRLAMAAGLHREPSAISDKISPFDQEMRRRLWFTILELEMQAGLDRGMPATITALDWDCRPPLNVHDEEFDEETQSMPPARPLEEFTRTSFLILTQQHLPLRIKMLSRINSIVSTVDYESVMAFDPRIREILDQLPQWEKEPSCSTARDMSRLMLCEFLLLLHQPYATNSDALSLHFYSQVARRNAALATMQIYMAMSTSRSLWFTNLRDDAFRATMALCHDIVVSSGPKEDFTLNREAIIELIEKSVDMFENRVRRLGQGFHSFWLTSSCVALCRSKMSPMIPSEHFAQETADRVVRLHGEIMAQQEPDAADETVGLDRDSALVEPSTEAMGHHLHAQQTHALPDFDAFGPIDPFNDSLFDFDMADIWNMGMVNMWK